MPKRIAKVEVCEHVIDGDVVDSRPTTVADFPAIRRRRVCLACGFRWSTFEISSKDFEHLRKAGERIVRITRISASLSEILAERDAPIGMEMGDQCQATAE